MKRLAIIVMMTMILIPTITQTDDLPECEVDYPDMPDRVHNYFDHQANTVQQLRELVIGFSGDPGDIADYADELQKWAFNNNLLTHFAEQFTEEIITCSGLQTVDQAYKDTITNVYILSGIYSQVLTVFMTDDDQLQDTALDLMTTRQDDLLDSVLLFMVGYELIGGDFPDDE